jgi:cytoskeletal protein CcmA (bactofilin family)
MFLKRGQSDGREDMNSHEETTSEAMSRPEPAVAPTPSRSRADNSNTILKGSKLIGDINVTCDLELSGDIEGNIISDQDSKIVIKGTCKGNIETKKGDVIIDGELIQGNIKAGSNVTVSGKFNGGEVTACGKISINGEFNGKLEANEVEIGPGAHGKGEVLYKEYISIAKGANVEVEIHKAAGELKLVKGKTEEKAAIKEAKVTTPPDKEISNG